MRDIETGRLGICPHITSFPPGLPVSNAVRQSCEAKLETRFLIPCVRGRMRGRVPRGWGMLRYDDLGVNLGPKVRGFPTLFRERDKK